MDRQALNRPGTAVRSTSWHHCFGRCANSRPLEQHVDFEKTKESPSSPSERRWLWVAAPTKIQQSLLGDQQCRKDLDVQKVVIHVEGARRAYVILYSNPRLSMELTSKSSAINVSHSAKDAEKMDIDAKGMYPYLGISCAERTAS